MDKKPILVGYLKLALTSLVYTLLELLKGSCSLFINYKVDFLLGLIFISDFELNNQLNQYVTGLMKIDVSL